MSNVDTGLIGHWPLTDNTNDHSPAGRPTKAVDVELGASGPSGKAGTAARFNGESALLEVADHDALHFGTREMTVAAWINSDENAVDVVGSVASKFDTDARKGLELAIVTNTGVTSTAQANRRHLHFGIDNARLDPAWQDCGRPGNAVLISAMTVSNGLLYAGTLETGADEMGHLWRYDGGQKWVDLGNPVGCNMVHSVVEFDGAVYCGTGRYHCAGSVLGETLNQAPGGKVFRVTPDGHWEDCGQPGGDDAVPEEQPVPGYATGKADDVTGLTVYRGELYCTSNHRLGVFKYEGGKNWKYVGLDQRILSFTIYRGQLYALINGGPVYRYEGGSDWAYCGNPEGSRQTYSAATHLGRLYVGTWPNGEVFRYEGGEEWALVRRVGYGMEVMGMALYNSKIYVGELPMANVWRLDGDHFALVGNLDSSTAPLRRVWSFAVYEGKLFAGTLPSGHVRSVEAGKMATADDTFPSGWHHVAAVKGERELKVYLDGKPVCGSAKFHAGDYDLTNEQPLKIGFGAYEHFDGLMSDVRLYDRALGPDEIAQLARA